MIERGNRSRYVALEEIIRHVIASKNGNGIELDSNPIQVGDRVALVDRQASGWIADQIVYLGQISSFDAIGMTATAARPVRFAAPAWRVEYALLKIFGIYDWGKNVMSAPLLYRNPKTGLWSYQAYRLNEELFEKISHQIKPSSNDSRARPYRYHPLSQVPEIAF